MPAIAIQLAKLIKEDKLDKIKEIENDINKKLLLQRFNTKSQDMILFSPLTYSIKYGRFEILKYFMGTFLDFSDLTSLDNFDNPVGRAAEFGHLDIFIYLVDKMVDANLSDRFITINLGKPNNIGILEYSLAKGLELDPETRKRIIYGCIDSNYHQLVPYLIQKLDFGKEDFTKNYLMDTMLEMERKEILIWLKYFYALDWDDLFATKKDMTIGLGHMLGKVNQGFLDYLFQEWSLLPAHFADMTQLSYDNAAYSKGTAILDYLHKKNIPIPQLKYYTFDEKINKYVEK